MLFGPNLSLILLLLVFRVSCDVVSIEIMNGISNDDGIKYYFVTTITHGQGEQIKELDIHELESSGYFCLQVNERVQLLARYEHKSSQTLQLKVSYDSGKYESPETFKEETRFKDKSKVCFLYGNFEPFSLESTVNIILYVRFITDETFFNRENILRFTASRTPGRSNIEIRNIFGKYYGFNFKKIQIYKKEEGPFYEEKKCPEVSGKDFTFSFKLDGQDFTFTETGAFTMAFIDENVRRAKQKGLNNITPTEKPKLECKDKSAKITFPVQNFKTTKKPEIIL